MSLAAADLIPYLKTQAQLSSLDNPQLISDIADARAAIDLADYAAKPVLLPIARRAKSGHLASLYLLLSPSSSVTLIKWPGGQPPLAIEAPACVTWMGVHVDVERGVALDVPGPIADLLSEQIEA